MILLQQKAQKLLVESSFQQEQLHEDQNHLFSIDQKLLILSKLSFLGNTIIYEIFSLVKFVGCFIEHLVIKNLGDRLADCFVKFHLDKHLSNNLFDNRF